MNVSTCLNILREIKDVAFATVDENNQPQVRIIDVMLVEDNKLYFCTARGKDFYKQLKNHPYVAITGMNKEYQMVRLNGPVKRLENQKYWINRIFKHNSSMNNVYPNESRYILEAFCLEEGELEFFDLGKEPIYRESFSMNKEIKPKGFSFVINVFNVAYVKRIVHNNVFQIIKFNKNIVYIVDYVMKNVLYKQ